MPYSLDAAIGRWGTPTHPIEISAAARDFLTARLGELQPRPRRPSAEAVLPPGRLPNSAYRELADALGDDHVDTSRLARLRHSGGSSLIDYAEQRAAQYPRAVDAVLQPGSHEEVAALLAICQRRAIAVVPFGGGTSVVGGVAPEDSGRGAVVAVAFDRMADLVDVDEVSLTATVQPGITGPALERLLEARGLHWGHLPQSWERATIGGYLATRSAGQASTGYGRSDEGVEAITLATPAGTVRLGRAPSSAAGPDLRQLFIGSEGVFGIITEATLRVRRQPRYRHYEGLLFPDFASGSDAFRALGQADLAATVMRLSDASETEVTMAMSGPQGRAKYLLDRYLSMKGITDGGCLAILGWEGVSPKASAARRDAAWVALRRYGAVALGSRVGESWRAHRFDGPYLRDVLLDDGCIVETLETAAAWATLPAVHAAVAEALRGSLAAGHGEPIVFCHVSHVYSTGASLYFTAIAPAADDPADQWRTAKQAASAAIMANGATITHHHAVGTDHRAYLTEEVGSLGVAALAAVKGAVDPTGILNPGKLIP
jgi:alkyldihydroxyacetonephosphate synthase